MTIQKKSSDSFLLLALVLALGGLVFPAASAQLDSRNQGQPHWQSPLHQDHPLAGKIWMVAQQQFITQDQLLARLQLSPVLLLGEKHDNPDHHRLRLALLDRLLLSADSALMVLEMLNRNQQSHIDTLTTEDLPPEGLALAERLTWNSEAWPWQFYGPAVTLALQRGTRLLAGNINDGEIMEIYRDSRPTSPQPLAADQLQQLERDIDSSHCGMLPAEQFPAMMRVQQARDQQMADALMADPGRFDQRILLAGNYHIRHDLGVPNYLPEQMSAPLSVAFLEVDPEHDVPADYLQQLSDIAAYDVIWFTPALRPDDYCADMRAGSNP